MAIKISDEWANFINAARKADGAILDLRDEMLAATDGAFTLVRIAKYAQYALAP